jgi:hypothetical protein
MQALPRIVAFALVSSLMILSVVGADDKDKKAEPPKGEAKKTEPAKKDAPDKKEEPDKKDADKKRIGRSKLPPPKGNRFKGKETDKDAAERKLLRQTKIPATVVAVVEDKKSLRLRLTIPYVKINEGQLQNYYKAQNLQQMLQAQAQLYELATVEKEVEWTAAEDFKVRMRNPPPQFDAKGRPKRYTKKELQELKGNDKLPYFPAEFSNIKAGQLVEVTLLQKKTAARSVRRGKDADAETSPDDLPKMSMIIILAEPKN